MGQSSSSSRKRPLPEGEAPRSSAAEDALKNSEDQQMTRKTRSSRATSRRVPGFRVQTDGQRTIYDPGLGDGRDASYFLEQSRGEYDDFPDGSTSESRGQAMMRYTAEQRFQTEIQKSRTAGKSVVAPSEFASFVNRGRNISARGVSKVSTDDDVRDEMRGKFKDAFGAVAEWKTIDAMNLDGYSEDSSRRTSSKASTSKKRTVVIRETPASVQSIDYDRQSPRVEETPQDSAQEEFLTVRSRTNKEDVAVAGVGTTFPMWKTARSEQDEVDHMRGSRGSAATNASHHYAGSQTFGTSGTSGLGPEDDAANEEHVPSGKTHISFFPPGASARLGRPSSKSGTRAGTVSLVPSTVLDSSASGGGSALAEPSALGFAIDPPSAMFVPSPHVDPTSSTTTRHVAAPPQTPVIPHYDNIHSTQQLNIPGADVLAQSGVGSGVDQQPGVSVSMRKSARRAPTSSSKLGAVESTGATGTEEEQLQLINENEALLDRQGQPRNVGGLLSQRDRASSRVLPRAGTTSSASFDQDDACCSCCRRRPPGRTGSTKGMEASVGSVSASLRTESTIPPAPAATAATTAASAATSRSATTSRTILTHLSAREFEAYATRRAAQLQNRSTSSSLFLRTTRTFSTTYGRDSTLGTHYQELGVDAIDAGCGARLRYCIRNFLLYSPWPLYVNIGAQVAGNLYTRFRTQNYEDYFYT